ncbi:hypothetical protein [Burkholderia perseverans]|nr:hypothetical protein [Burkholderia perseverans]
MQIMDGDYSADETLKSAGLEKIASIGWAGVTDRLCLVAAFFIV